MKKFILSFDYELFFGEKSGTVRKTLIEPTNKILNAMDDIHLKGNFFIDVLMIKYLKQNVDQESTNDVRMIENQLRDIVRRGHRIELHLHPHWIDAKYNGDGTWNFEDFHHYSLSTFSEEDILKMFTEGAQYLNTVGSQIIPKYKVCAFRAGGWAIQPFDKLKRAFLETNISIDSSAALGKYYTSKYSNYDFRNIPSLSFYKFNNNVAEQSMNGDFIEVPISTHRWTLLERIVCKIYRTIWSINVKSITDGTHYRSDLQECNTKKVSRLYYLSHLAEFQQMYTFSQINYKVLGYIVHKSKSNIICFIDHPKDFSESTIPSIKSLNNEGTSMLYVDFLTT